MKGSIEPGEVASDAARRELFEEAGIADARVVDALGLWDASEAQQIWSFHRCDPAQSLPDAWSHVCADDGGHVFELYWHPLEEDPIDAHPVFVRAVRTIRERLAQRRG